MTTPKTLLRGALGAALLAANSAASAGLFLPSFVPGSLSPGDLDGVEAGRWYVNFSQTSAGTAIDGATTLDGHVATALEAGGIAAASDSAATVGGKSASAAASVTATSLGVRAAAGAPLEPAAGGVRGLSFASIQYYAFLPSADAVTLDLALTGTLFATGARGLLDSEPSGSAVAVAALGSQVDATTTSIRRLYLDAGLDPDAEGEALARQLLTWPTTAARNFSTHGEVANVFDRDRLVDASFSVTADGTRMDCDSVLSEICGTWFHSFTLTIFAAAQNGGDADLSHTLTATAVHVPAGVTLRFAPGQEIPVLPASVPAPAAFWSMGLGIAALLGRGRGQRA